MALLYADENFPLPVVDGLRAAGHDVVTVQETGRGGQRMSDPEVLAVATTERRAVLTLNRKDFIRLHREGAPHAGIIVCTFDHDFAAQGRRIDAAIRQGAELDGQLLRVNRPAD